MPLSKSKPRSRPPTLRWIGSVEGSLEIIDQRKLPMELVFQRLDTVEDAWAAIRTLAVRGAPAIGVAAAFGMVLAARTVPGSSQAAVLIEVLKEKGAYLKSSRPTAVNLEWAVDQMIRVAVTERGVGVRQLQRRLLQEAKAILEEDRRMCQAMGKFGAELIAKKPFAGILTHCNAGALATADQGTALSVVYELQKMGLKFRVFADETRPLLQGARLTAWELAASGVDVTVICDNMAGVVMKQSKIQLVIVGADRIAKNGDTANKIGTYSVAVLAEAHGIPFYVAAPYTTFDLSIPSGDHIPIEERPAEEITRPFNTRIAPEDTSVFNPAFDITPARLITALITDRGIISPVTEKNISKLMDTP